MVRIEKFYGGPWPDEAAVETRPLVVNIPRALATVLRVEAGVFDCKKVLFVWPRETLVPFEAGTECRLRSGGRLNRRTHEVTLEDI